MRERMDRSSLSQVASQWLEGRITLCIRAAGEWTGMCWSGGNFELGKHFKDVYCIKKKVGASLVAQWLRICLPMQGTRVRALVWEDPTCRGATGPVSHNCWACVSGACAPQREAAIVRGPRTAMKSGPRLPQLEKALTQKWRPNTAINK